MGCVVTFISPELPTNAQSNSSNKVISLVFFKNCIWVKTTNNICSNSENYHFDRKPGTYLYIYLNSNIIIGGFLKTLEGGNRLSYSILRVKVIIALLLTCNVYVNKQMTFHASLSCIFMLLDLL